MAWCNDPAVDEMLISPLSSQDQDNVCATVLADGSMVSGTASGEVYQWRGNELFHVLAAHNGTVTALEALTEPGCLASAGADGGIR